MKRFGARRCFGGIEGRSYCLPAGLKIVREGRKYKTRHSRWPRRVFLNVKSPDYLAFNKQRKPKVFMASSGRQYPAKFGAEIDLHEVGPGTAFQKAIRLAFVAQHKFHHIAAHVVETFRLFAARLPTVAGAVRRTVRLATAWSMLAFATRLDHSFSVGST